jgi:hypothetical protein
MISWISPKRKLNSFKGKYKEWEKWEKLLKKSIKYKATTKTTYHPQTKLNKTMIWILMNKIRTKTISHLKIKQSLGGLHRTVQNSIY